MRRSSTPRSRFNNVDETAGSSYVARVARAAPQQCSSSSGLPHWRPISLHETPVTDDQRLARQRIGRQRREEQRRLRNVLYSRELAVAGVLEHHVADDILFGDAQRFRLLGNLFLD